jgi:hypothetical protein
VESEDKGRRAAWLSLLAALLAGLGSSSELLAGLSFYSWTALPTYFVWKSWAQICVAASLAFLAAFLGQPHFRPWRIPRKLKLDPIHWNQSPVAGVDWLGRLAILLCLLPLVSRPLLALLAMFLVGWTRAGYQRWERHRSQGVEHLHHFFGVEWRTGCLSSRKADPTPFGPRSDEAVYAARVKKSRQIATAIASGVGLFLMMGEHYVGPMITVAVAYLMLFPGYLISRVVYLFLPSGIHPGHLPQRRKLSSGLVEDRSTSGLMDVGCTLLALCMGGFQLIAMVLAIPLFLAHEAAEWMGWPGGWGVALVFVGMLGRFVGYKNRTYYELEAASRELWQHDVKGPYQLSKVRGTVVALGLTMESNRYLPVAYLSSSKSIKLTRQGEDYASAWRLVERLSALVRLVPINAQMALEPKKVEHWIREGSLAKRLDIWSSPAPVPPEQPSWLPPVD